MAKVNKNTSKQAFTLVEVAIVISISTLMLIAFVATIGSRISVQRYKDSTINFADFIRDVYSDVINVENARMGQIESQNDYCTLAGQATTLDSSNNTSANPNPEESYPGRSGCAIYGKLISFGEKNEKTIYIYDVIGRASDFTNPIVGASSTIDELRIVNSDVMALTPDKNNTGQVSLTTAALSSQYNLQWGAWAEDTKGDLFHGSIMIVRAPSSGAVRTYFLKRTLPIQELVTNHDYKNLGNNTSNLQFVVNAVDNKSADLSEYLNGGDDPTTSFVFEEIDLCVESDDLFTSFSARNNIRIKADGHNTTAVEFVESDKPGSEGGNRCR